MLIQRISRMNLAIVECAALEANTEYARAPVRTGIRTGDR